MKVAPHLLEMLDVVTPAREMNAAPVFVRALVPAGELVTEWPPKPRHACRGATLVTLAVLRDNPGATAPELKRLLARKGHHRSRSTVAAHLQDLRRAGLARRITLTSRRDIERAGGVHLWEAVEP